MKDVSLHETFVRAMEKEIPKKTKLADFVADSLCIEKETAYRRLRGEVQFSLREAGILATLLNISLDNLIHDHSKSLTLGLPIDYLTGTYDRSQIEDIIHYLHEFTQEPGCEFGMALSGIPFSLFLQYKRLARFYRLKYVNHTTNRPVSIPYEKIEESEAKIEYREELYLLFRQIANTYYVWDRQIIQLLVNDIKYAASIRLIAGWEVAELKQELFRFLDDLEQIAIKGIFPETGNKCELYISDAHIDVSYAYMCSQKRQVSTLSAFVIFSSISLETQTFQKVNNWVKSLKRFSTLVSGIGERERILFFEEQREIVDTL
ncbi:hypothetical protein [Parabacteroides sp. PF5-6]|uniref:hypothetical protein n=1 Tax=Parabacteroides sp. PF5-6 TaxID=1742403 RepID=UPI002405E0F7|nr:hypothetical protein [Parabacteroides sp. PF5-6]MDF9831229.1 hypothetical protein [Parabacteroides sp. PF5-6]